MFLVPVTRESRQLARLQSRLIDDTIDRLFGCAADTENVAARSPALDVVEAPSSYTVKLEVPGVSKDDIKVSVEGRQVSVQAQSQTSEDKQDGEQIKERIIYRERTATRYSRSFTLPLEVDQAGTVAKLEHGVLTLTLPKRSALSAAQITVN